MSPITLFHNPACGTSRKVLGPIRNSGVEPTAVEYLKTPLGRDERVRLVAGLGTGVRALLRQKGTPCAALKLDDPAGTDAQAIDFIVQHPVPMNRPVVATPLGTRPCRPSKGVLNLLPDPQRGALAEEGGQAVVDAGGCRAV